MIGKITKKIFSYLFVGLWILIAFAPSIIFHKDSKYILNAQQQSKEVYKQIGFPEGFKVNECKFYISHLGADFFASATIEQKPTTLEQQKALKDRVAKYYAEKLNNYGWKKVEGYKHLYRKDGTQWINVEIDYNSNDIFLKEQSAIFSWYETITDSLMVKKYDGKI